MRYRACGVTVRSDLPLPELASSKTERPDMAADVEVRLLGARRKVAQPQHWMFSQRLSDGRPWMSAAKVDGGYLLHFHELADFFVDAAGRRVVCTASSDTQGHTLRHLLLDQVLPLVLNLRGREALHATAALTPLGACAFVGSTGTGKSTLAAAFQLAGYPVLSDDCLVVMESQGKILAVPAYPGVRLWGDALGALCDQPGLGQPVADYTPKQRVVLSGGNHEFVSEPQPLARIYALTRVAPVDGGEAASPAIETLSGREGLVELLSSTFRLDITDRAMLVRQFDLLKKIVSLVGVRRLLFPDAFSALPAVREAVLADLRAG